MAILSAIATRHGGSVLDILRPSREELPKISSAVQICALIDSYGSPKDTAFIASTLVAEGFTAIKIKVIIFDNYAFLKCSVSNFRIFCLACKCSVIGGS